MTAAHDIAAGAHNLLVNCAGVRRGESLLIVREDPALGWYDAQVPEIVADEARRLGVAPSFLDVGKPGLTSAPRVKEAIAAHTCVIYFARIGDQDRFAPPMPGKRLVMCYLRDTGMLASAFGRTDHRALHDVKAAVNDVLFGATRIEIRCPLGTKIAGAVPDAVADGSGDVSVVRFPLGVPQPMEAMDFSGRVALARYLTPTGSRPYDPPCVALADTVFAEVEAGRITGFTGDRGEAARVADHYDRVAATFGIDRNAVHSWHAGIHPGCDYAGEAAADPDRWSNTVFNNPRCLHFHTCGNYAPGEISWNLFDHTVLVDGVALWESGRLRPEAFPQTQACLEAWPELTVLFANPAEAIGLPGEDGSQAQSVRPVSRAASCANSR